MSEHSYNTLKDPLLQQYIADIRNIPMLDAKREKELSYIIHHSTDKKAIRIAEEEMTNANLKLVIKFAIKYYNRIRRYADFNISLMDLISEGNIGLMRAVELFDADLFDNRFSTYAVPNICRHMDSCIKNSRFIRIPRNHYKHFSEYNKVRNEYGSDIDDDTIIEKMGVTSNMFKMIKSEQREHMVVSAEDSDMQEFIQNIAAVDQESWECVDGMDLREYLYTKIKELKEKDQDIIFFTFFGNKNMTLGEIGNISGVSRQAIEQRYPRAMQKLRASVLADLEKQ
jgi:RNA polymerase primary sigma factor